MALPARAGDDPAGVDAKTAFAKMKSLAGSWSMKGDGEHNGTIDYRVTANGSAVMETYFAGTNHEMITMYHLDGDDLRLTHYCAIGNQPRLKLDRKASTPEKLIFVSEGGTNFDPAKDMHMHSGRINIRDKDHIDAEWDGYNDGKKTGTHSFALSRK
jgi:hypothetical protein